MTSRLSVNINDECHDALKAYMRAHGVTATESVRRALSILAFVDATLAAGDHLAVLERRNGKERVRELRVVPHEPGEAL